MSILALRPIACQFFGAVFRSSYYTNFDRPFWLFYQSRIVSSKLKFISCIASSSPLILAFQYICSFSVKQFRNVELVFISISFSAYTLCSPVRICSSVCCLALTCPIVIFLVFLVSIISPPFRPVYREKFSFSYY